jgi:DNA-binding NtrC family response regulator
MGTSSNATPAKSADVGHRADQNASAGLRLLIISDCPERMKQLKAALNVGEIEITGVNSLDRLNNSIRRDYDLVAVDVGLEHLARALMALRSRAEYAEIPVLVECSRISTSIGFASLLPKYRAMPCCQSDLITLVKRRTAFESSESRTRGIL